VTDVGKVTIDVKAGQDRDDELNLQGDNSFNLGERRVVRGFEDFD
jgi:hypothetical protein